MEQSKHMNGLNVIFTILGTLITGNFSIDDLSGPVGIYKATEDVAQYGVYNLMYWAAILEYKS